MTERVPFLSDAHHFAIACVAARAAQLDHHIEHTINYLFSKKQKTARFLLKNLGQDRIVDLLDALLADSFPDEEEPRKNLIKKIKDCRAARNDVLHQIWGPSAGDDPEAAAHHSMRPHRDHTAKTKTATEINDIAEGLLACSKAIISWHALAHSDNILALQKKSTQQFLREHSLAPLDGDQTSKP